MRESEAVLWEQALLLRNGGRGVGPGQPRHKTVEVAIGLGAEVLGLLLLLRHHGRRDPERGSHNCDQRRRPVTLTPHGHQQPRIAIDV